MFSIVSIGDASTRAKAFTTYPAYSANRLEIFDGDKTEIRGCNGHAGPLKNPKPSINSAQSVKNIYARWNFGNSTAMGRVFVSKNGSIRSYPYTRNPQINSWLSWKTEVLRQFLFNLILNQVVGRQVLAMASSIQFRKME